MIELLKKFAPVFDLLLLILALPSAIVMKALRMFGFERLPLCKRLLFKIGVFPINNHYYEPQFDMRKMKRGYSDDRPLPGINWNLKEQLELLGQFSNAKELEKLPMEKSGETRFYLNNESFKSGDAEFWYQLIRLKKPKRIFEVGSGFSTLMAVNAVKQNKAEDPAYQCKHVCIEPYEMPWLEGAGVTVLRKKVEDVDLAFFSELQVNDILFIDSSHIIRPDGDVLFEYLELLPTLNPGVIVHVHDIFSPRNYLKEWLLNEVYFWNEQYLVEAFLTHNNKWKIIGALNLLHHNHYAELKRVCPFLEPSREPGSFYLQKIA